VNTDPSNAHHHRPTRPAESDTHLDAIPAQIWIANPQGALVFVSQHWIDYTGVPLEHVVGRAPFATEWIHPDDLSNAGDSWTGIHASGQPGAFEARLRRLDGDYRWFVIRVAPLRDERAHITQWYGSNTDVEDLKRAEAELDAVKKSEDRLRLVLHTIPVMVTTARPDGSLDFINDRWLEYLGLPLERVQDWGWTTVTHPDDIGAFVDGWRSAMAAGEPFEGEARVPRADGQYRWLLVRAVPLRNASGDIVHWYVTSVDIEDRKRAETALRANETELRQVIDAIPQLIVAMSPAGQILYANEAVLQSTGLSLDDVRSESFRSWLFHPEDLDKLRTDRGERMGRGVPFELEMRARLKDRQYRWFLVQYKPLLDTQGQVSRWYATGTDIDDRKRAEEQVRNENVALREEITRASMFEEIVGASGVLRNVLRQVEQVAPTDSTVLITGETGTGKELVARAIHQRSARAGHAFVSVNCAAVPASLIASELFGHERGAFTGALQRRQGRFELADAGTIFLDEVGELPPEAQLALLRVLQEREFERVGGTRPIRVNVRVIAATNRDLEIAVVDKAFRSDLFYRLNVFPIEVPALRERLDDIPLLVDYFVHRFAKRAGKQITGVNRQTLSLLQSYPWPGNIRELQNVIERAVIVCDTTTLSVDERWLVQRAAAPKKTNVSLDDDLVAHERARVEAALLESKGRVDGPLGAASRLGIPRSTLESRIRALNIDKHRFKTTTS
jgi:formate hydrogenlyase transcriptional activator